MPGNAKPVDHIVRADGRAILPLVVLVEHLISEPRLLQKLLLDGKESIFVHNIAVKTGDERGAGTNSKVWIELHDENQNGSGKINLRGGSFERGDVDHFPTGWFEKILHFT